MKKNSFHFSGTVALLLLFGLMVSGQAQITAPTADFSKPLTYSVSDRIDNLHVFYQTHGGEKLGSLTATGPVAGTFDFTWTKYDVAGSGFSIPLTAEAGVASSTISNLQEGGYRVAVTNGVDVDTAYIAWVMLNNLVVTTEKDADGKLPSFRSGCADGNYVTISGSVALDTFRYYDPVSSDTLLFPNDFEIEWTSDNPDLTIFNPTNKDAMGENYSNQPPVKDTWYILTAIDSLGMVERDCVLYDTKHTRAEFSVRFYDKVEQEWVDDLTTDWSLEKGSLDAPLEVEFINESQNAEELEWVLLDTTDIFGVESNKVTEETPDSTYKPRFTYYTADKIYFPYLISTSDQNCRDTFLLEDGVQVVAALLDIPNAFSPNSSVERNQRWRFVHQSIKECKVTISDRSGKVVYSQRIDDIYQWEGWDGRMITRLPAPAGQYFYVVQGTGYDSQEFVDNSYLARRKLVKEAEGSGQGGGQGTGTGGDGEETVLFPPKYTGWLYLFR